MVKLTNVSKAAAVSAVVAASLLMPARIASADTSNFVPNTTNCGGTSSTQSKNDGTFTVKWNNGHTFTITVTKAPKYDITLFASSYHISGDNYKGGCFGQPGTAPQTYDGNTQTITLPAGQTGSQTVNIVLPDTCYNEQVDLYYGKSVYGKPTPLNGTVDSNGHNAYGYIAGNFMLTSMNDACVGGKGGGTTPTTPTTPSTPVVVTPAAAVTPAPTLTNTGLNVRLTSVIAAAILAAAAYVFTRRSKVSE